MQHMEGIQTMAYKMLAKRVQTVQTVYKLPYKPAWKHVQTVQTVPERKKSIKKGFPIIYGLYSLYRFLRRFVAWFVHGLYSLYTFRKIIYTSINMHCFANTHDTNTFKMSCCSARFEESPRIA